MKERIISALKELSNPDPEKVSSIKTELLKELFMDEMTLRIRSKEILKEILHHYSEFAIGTIDSFTHRIVRAFAHDLHLPVNFEVETDADKLIREAVDLLISKIGEDEKLTEILVKFSEERTDEQKSWQIETQLQQVAKHLLEEEGATNADKLRHLSIDDFLLFRNNLRKVNAQLEEKIISIAEKARKLISENNLETEEFAYGKSGIAARFKSYANGNLEKFPETNKNIEKTISGGNWPAGKVSASSKAAIENIKSQLEIYWKELEEIREKEFPEFIFRRLVHKNIYAVAVLNEIEKIIFSFRSEQNILHISEFNRIISRVVFAEPVPFIYERLGEKYTNYLIDEFQDTSVVQWQNLLPLVENALAGNNFTMVVGDGKQAIYRWRGGEVSQFAALPKVNDRSNNPLVKDREQSLIRNYREQNLAKNYRSKVEIIQFNNLFFRELSGLLSENSKIIYKELEQEFVPEKTGGYVRVETIVPDENDYNSLFIQKAISTVQQLKSEGWQYSEICILTRTNTEGSAIATALLENGISVLSSESLLLKHSSVVAFMVSMLRCIEHPSDALAGAQVLEFLAANKKINSPLENCLNDLQENKNQVQPVLAKNNIPFHPADLSRLPLYQRCEELISIFNLGEKPDSYLLFFLDEVLNYSNGKNSGREDFFQWWDDRSRKASVVVAEGTNAVSVMTIHKSKGLEFPVVIIPFADWDFKKQKDEIWVNVDDKIVSQLTTALIGINKELQYTKYKNLYEEEQDKSILDMINVLYVAMTRAEQRLYIFSEATDKKIDTPTNVSQCFISALEKMQITFNGHIAEFGKPGTRIAADKKQIRAIHPTHLQSQNWENKIRIRSASADLWDEEVNLNRDKGKLLHEILSFIETKKDIDTAIQNAIQSGLTDISQKENLKNHLEEIVSLPELAECFSGKGKFRRETEILFPDGKRLRPDRVIENKDATIILDYKTGKPDAKFKKQLDNYANALREMGYDKIEKKIVYTESLEVESW